MPARSFREALERRRGMDVSKLASSKADLYKRLKSVFEDYVADLSKVIRFSLTGHSGPNSFDILFKIRLKYKK